MGQSLIKIYVHIVFSTKNRYPFIDQNIEEDLYSYLAKICKEWDCHPVKIGGYVDHVHILVNLSKKITISKLLEEVKKSSSKWIKTKGEKYEDFYWQNGYAAFSVNYKGIDGVGRYITNQKEHHSKQTFQDECRGFFKEYGMEYDERYVWD